ncbi:MAG: fatty acid hydroxylase family protein [Flavobacteriia bacterium]|nr:fatty acid hydroxylase family protein [Flavobacteriia bacterium]
MNALTFAVYTVILLISTNLIGLVYSMVVLYTPLFKKYRIQQKPYQKGIFKKRFPLYFLNLMLLLLISGVGAYFLFPFIETTWTNGWIIALQVLIAFVVDDVFFYFFHRWIHQNKFMLGKIHSIHHRASPPFPLEYLYNHPLEWMLGMIGAALGFAVIMIFMPINMFAFFLFGAIRNLHEIHIHSDLNLPFISQIPLISKSKHHDDHHAMLEGNYASTFAWWDKIFKTEIK